ncbi:hypothetical protein RUND412_009310 [Rhizina undulata]
MPRPTKERSPSPDPLTADDGPTVSNTPIPAKVRPPSKNRRVTALATSVTSTPNRMTPAANNMLNPWRIKVVVEAERHDNGPVGSASRSRSSKTIMVPLGGLEFEADTPLGVEVGGGRKSTAARKRGATPGGSSTNALGARTITRTRTTKVPVKGLDSSPVMPLLELEEDELTQVRRGRSATRRKPTPKKTPARSASAKRKATPAKLTPGAKAAGKRKKVDTAEPKPAARILGRRRSIVGDAEDRTEGEEEEGIIPQELQEQYVEDSQPHQTPRLTPSTRSLKSPAETLLPSPRAALSPKNPDSMPSASPNSTDSEELPDFTFVSGSPEKSYVPQRRKKTSKANVPPREDSSSHSEPPLAESFYIVSSDSDDSFETHFMLPPELSGTHLSVDPREDKPEKDKPEKDAPQSSPPPDHSHSPGLCQNEHHLQEGPQTPHRVQGKEQGKESPQPPPRGWGQDPNARTKVSRTPPDLSMVKFLSNSFQEFLGVHGMATAKEKFGPSIEVGGLLPVCGEGCRGGGEGRDQEEEGGEEGEVEVEMGWRRASRSGDPPSPPPPLDDDFALPPLPSPPPPLDDDFALPPLPSPPPPSDDDFALPPPPPVPITIVSISSASESSLSLSRSPTPTPVPKWQTQHWRRLDCILRSSKTLPAQPSMQYHLSIEDPGAIKDVIGRLRIGGDGALVLGTRESAGVGRFLREGGWEEGWTVADVARKVGAWVIARERRRLREGM